MFGDLDRPLNASRGLSAIAEFLIPVHSVTCVVFILVTLSATDGNNFSGFLLVARDSSQNRVGTISESSNDIRTACQVRNFVLYASKSTFRLIVTM